MVREFKADCVGWQYQLGLISLRPPSDFAEGLLNSDLVADFVQAGLTPFATGSLASLNRLGAALAERASTLMRQTRRALHRGAENQKSVLRVQRQL